MRSTFHHIDESRFRDLCRSGRIIPVYGHVVLEETFRAYGIEAKRIELVQRWLPFVRDTVDRFCEDFITIWNRELVQGHGIKTNIYMSSGNQERLLASLNRIPVDGSWRAWHASQADRDTQDVKRAAQRETSKEIRQEVADWRKVIGYHPRVHGVSRFSEYVNRELDFAGRGFIHALLDCKNPLGVANRWSRDKSSYPFFTTFVRNMLYIGHRAATNPNAKIDLNAQADLDLMTHLLRAEVIVSNETGFLRDAFNDLWRPHGKVLFSSEEFAKLIAKM